MSGEDLSSALITPKPVTPITHYQCPTLKLTNYTVWAIQIKVILEAHGLWEMIEPKENTQVDEKKDKATTAFLYQALTEDVILQVAGCKSAKELWESLKKRHVGEEKVQQARLQSLMIGFQTLQMKEDDSVDAFTAKLNGYATKAKEFGKTLDQSLLVRKLLDSTPDRTVQPGKYATTDASIWYLDNGASNHMTGTKSHFRDIDESIIRRVRFGDGSYVKIKGRGSILLGCRNHEQKIVSDVYYIPNLKSNILSLGQLTEIGCLPQGLEDKTPYEALYNRKPNLENLRIFGCTAYAKITIPHLQKDVKFMETKPWDWDNNREETSTQGSFWASFMVEGVDNGNTTQVNSEQDNTYQEQEPITASNSSITHQPQLQPHSQKRQQKLLEQGIDFDEVFAPVARIEIVLFFHLKEEVYVTQPEGFIQQGNSGKVYKLTKALYGLRQAPRAWNVKLDQTLKSLDFKKCNLEQAVYTKKEIDLFKSQMKDKFEMSDLGLLAYYLGIEVTQTGGEITIKQTGYINKILKESSMMESNDTKIPMDPGTKLVKAEDGNSVDATYYRRTKEHGIIYKKEGGCKITGYSDSSYGVNTDQGKGTTGIVFYFGESPITWCTQKQPTVALSSCESEFMAATGAACQALWLKRLLSELTGWEEKRITLKVDNISAIALVRNPVFHGRSKHIDIRYHFIRECVENGHINVEHVSGELQRADILTKALPRLKFVTMRQMLGVQDLGRSNDQD
ncbi:zinc finger, CCHC-type containing protein [Tanacetum coccineum]